MHLVKASAHEVNSQKICWYNSSNGTYYLIFENDVI